MDSHQQAVRKLLGKTIKCTLSDGRTATGSLICIDRLKNIVLGNVVEERTVDSAIYSGSKGGEIVTTRRLLGQAVVPGIHLVKVEINSKDYEQCSNQLQCN